MMLSEWGVGKYLEGKGCGLIEVPSWNLPGETRENHENPQVSRCLSRYSNHASPECRSRPTCSVSGGRWDKLTELDNNTGNALNVISCINIPLNEIGLKWYICITYILQCWVVLARFCPIIVQVKPFKTPFGLVTPFITIPVTRSYNHTQLLLTPLRGYTVTVLARLCLQLLIAPLTIASWLSVFDSTADCCLRRLAHWLDCVSLVTVEIQPKVAFFGPSRSHPAQPSRYALSRVGYREVCCPFTMHSGLWLTVACMKRWNS
jgi:hypothetical protein